MLQGINPIILAITVGFPCLLLSALIITRVTPSSRTRRTPLLDAARKQAELRTHINRLCRENQRLLDENHQLKEDRARLTEANKLKVQHWKPDA